MKKNKCNMILICVGILIVLLFMLFLLKNKEGMAVKCKYQYLGPNQTNTTLDDATINDFVGKYNVNMLQLGLRDNYSMDGNTYITFMKLKIFCSDEIKYYIQNNSFPINEFLVGELSTNTNIKLLPFDTNTIALASSCRAIYSSYVVPAYVGKTSAPPDAIEAQSIYAGTNPEPACDADVDDAAASLVAPSAPALSAPAASISPTAASAVASNSNVSDDACISSCNDFCKNMN